MSTLLVVKVAGRDFRIEIDGKRAQCVEYMGIVSESNTAGESIDAVVQGIMSKVRETQSNA
jgi:hypothetical protein